MLLMGLGFGVWGQSLSFGAASSAAACSSRPCKGACQLQCLG